MKFYLPSRGLFVGVDKFGFGAILRADQAIRSAKTDKDPIWLIAQ
jgi:hypothetical protein